MPKRKHEVVVSAPGILERLRHPSPRGKLYTFVAVSILSTIYLTVSTIWNDRDLLPKSHDEHSYAIQTQMIARGRLWMPQHELADFFESFQMLARPVYASIYFPGSALMYAPGVWLALPPWVMPVIVSGLATGFAYLLATRLIDGVAGLLVVLLLLACQWFRLNATLVMSQSPMMLLGLGMLLAWLRWREAKDVKWAVLIGACAGWAAIVRPADALAFALPVGVAMLWDFRGLPMKRVAAVIGVIILAAAAFLSLQLALNKGTTGHWLQAPHTLYLERDQPQTTYGFHTPDPQARPQSTLAQKQAYYAKFMVPDVQGHQLKNLGSIIVERLKLTADVALPTKLLLVFLAAGVFAVRGTPRVVVAAVPVLFFILYVPYTFYMTHYVIPIVVPLLVLVVLGAERIATWMSNATSRQLATTLAAAVLAVVAVGSLPELNPWVADDMIFAPKTILIRRWIADAVRTPAVVLVRYGPGENTHDEPVYNASVAWPDDAPVIVAHDLGPRNVELLAYYERVSPGRNYYLIDRATLKRQGPGRAADLARAIAQMQPPATNASTAPATQQVR
jgi:4-amino-4-deoxy-L-arabinose transferase-like glycosyltransferase